MNNTNLNFNSVETLPNLYSEVCNGDGDGDSDSNSNSNGNGNGNGNG